METEQSNSNPVAIDTELRNSASPKETPARGSYTGMLIYAAVLIAVFSRPLFRLIAFAPHAELYSHILLIPFISGYFIWQKRKELSPAARPEFGVAWLPFAAGAAVLAWYWMAVRHGWKPANTDYFAAMTLSFLCFLLGGGFISLGARWLKTVAFPVGFLIFCVPFPDAVRLWIETALQNGSAAAAYVFFRLSGMPVMQTGTAFQLPGFALEVAPECSGIHSSLVLIITSLLAAYMFLKRPVNRLWIVLAVIPLGLLRNGFRVFVIGQLCVRIGPQMIDSPIHHRGGPVFFVLSLVPLFLLLVYLNKAELRKEQAQMAPSK